MRRPSQPYAHLMFLSVFDLFKIGLGPSSSHTMGPMVAAGRFLDFLRESGSTPHRVNVTLHGSLAFTGKGHHSDKAVVLGLLGVDAATIQPKTIRPRLDEVAEKKTLTAAGLGTFNFDPERDITFDYTHPKDGHPNALTFRATNTLETTIAEQAYWSIGGGFVVTPDESRAGGATTDRADQDYPYPFSTSSEMLSMGENAGLTIAEMKRANECVARTPSELEGQLETIWSAMQACIDRGLTQEGILPGGLFVQRRAARLHRDLKARQGANDIQAHQVMDWLSVFAMAVNEENAAGARVVTSPTNGAAGVIPAVLRYYKDHCTGANEQGVKTFLLTAAAIGGIIKHNASISGAEVGCQGEVGSASAMAAAGLCAVLGGNNAQIENAAEIALEHHLGMTCDPVDGLVQVPCIERNAFGAVKAVTAASLAMHGDGSHIVPLDSCIETMRQTGLDMSEKYKETSTGGLAVNLPQC